MNLWLALKVWQKCVNIRIGDTSISYKCPLSGTLLGGNKMRKWWINSSATAEKGMGANTAFSGATVRLSWCGASTFENAFQETVTWKYNGNGWYFCL